MYVSNPTEASLAIQYHPVMEADPHAPARGFWAARRRFHKFLGQLGPAAPLAAVAVMLPLVGGLTLLGTVKQLGPWFRGQGNLGLALLVVVGSALAGTCVLPTYAVSMVAGWTFGFGPGLLAALLALTGAACLGYAMARRVVGDHVLERLQENPKWDAVRRAMVGRGAGRAMLIVILIRLAPIAPFGITNLVMAATRCPRRSFVLGSLLGFIPQTSLLVFVSSQLRDLRFEQDPWIAVAGIVSTLAVISTLGYIAKRALNRVTGAGAGAGADAGAL